VNEDLEGFLESMWMDIAVELSYREEGVRNGHVIVCEEVHSTTECPRYCKWYVDGQLVDYQDIEVLVDAPPCN
jgi:hypothetical protein